LWKKENQATDDGTQTIDNLNKIQASSVAHGQSTVIEKRKPSFKEKREFELLEKEIAELTKEKESITEKLNSGHAPFQELKQLSQRIIELTELLDKKELRWLELCELK